MPGETEVVFESQTLNFAYSTEYVLSLRDVSGAFQTGLTVDAVLNSTSVSSITDVNALSQYRIYNVTSLDTPVMVSLGGEADEPDTKLTLDAGSLSAFIPIRYGDYRLTLSTANASAVPLNNKLLNLNQGESKAIMICQRDDELGAATFLESGLPQSYDKTVNFINLATRVGDVDIYLVRRDETIDTAEYRLMNLTFGEDGTQVLPADNYEVIAVHEDSQGEQTLLDRTAWVGFTEEQNYVVVVQPAQTPTGYAIKILSEAEVITDVLD